MPLSQGQVINSRYRIVKLLGQGGFGAVYRAWDLNLQRACALKENLDTSPEARRQFEREAMVLANLAHPNLPRVTDHFVIENQGQYLVMDYVDGEDLASVVERQGAVPLSQALTWAEQVTDALMYMHRRTPPVVHRDIKPANIKITPEGKAMLVDFGLVKLYNPQMRTTLGARAVTPGYAPPEQYGHGNTDSRTDVYALGATLYTLLTGTIPAESVQRVSGLAMEKVHQVNPNIPEDISKVIERAMALNPASRFQSAAEFKSALKSPAPAVISPAPVEVRPVARTVAMPQPQSVGAPQVSDRPRSYPQPIQQPSLAPAKKSGSGLRTLVIVIAVVACIGIVGVGALVVGSIRQAAEEAETQTAEAKAAIAQATLSAQTSQTAQALQATGKALTATAEVYAAATARMQATENAAQQLTAAVEQAIQATEQAWQSLISGISISASSRTLVYGPTDGELVHEDDDLVESSFADVELRDFMVEVTFENPYPSSENHWDYGFLFRDTGANSEFRLILRYDGSWTLESWKDTSTTIGSGDLYNLNTNAGATNDLRLICEGSNGYLYVNDVLVAELNLSSRLDAGDVAVAIGFTSGYEVVGQSTSYSNFAVWSLP